MRDALIALLQRVKIERQYVSNRLARVLRDERELTFRTDLLNTICTRVERSPEFQEFANLKRWREGTKGYFPEIALSNFLKWSGAYYKEDPTEESFIQHLMEQFEKHLQPDRRIKVRYLISLPWLDDPSLRKDPIQGGWFQLRMYSASELQDIVQNDIRRTFFPSTAIDEDILERLELETWLVVETDEDPGIQIDWRWIDGTISLTDLPDRVQDVLGALVIYDWWTELFERCYWWPGFPQGTRIVLRDDWLISPRRPLIGKFAYDIVDKEQGLVSPETVPFQCSGDLRTLPEVVRTIESLGECEGTAFIRRTVLPFLVRAALTEASPASKRDQFLAHVTAIEALVGSGGLDARNRLAKRVGVLVSPDNQREGAERFGRIWQTRNKLVHGATLDTVDPELSWEARELAALAVRRTIDILQSYREHGVVLNREEFCGLLDALALGRGPKDLTRLLELWPDTDA